MSEKESVRTARARSQRIQDKSTHDVNDCPTAEPEWMEKPC